MFRTPRSLLGSLLATAALVTVTLGWLGWRLLDQQDALEDQRTRERTEAAADAIASGMRGRLAEAGEGLSSWLSGPTAPAPAIAGAAMTKIDAGTVAVSPAGGLPFVPGHVSNDEPLAVFAGAEALEFGGADPAVVAARYRAMAGDRDPRVRAGAFLRLARVLRRTRDYSGARDTYRDLAVLGSVRTDNLPAELIGLDGQRAMAKALGDQDGERAIGARLLNGLNRGRWLITRGTAEFYRDGLTPDPVPAAWHLAGAMAEVWNAAGGRLSARGQAVVTGDGHGVLVLWRSTGNRAAMLAAWSDQFFPSATSGGMQWQLTAPEGQHLSGEPVAHAESATRLLGDADAAWTLRVWTPAAASGAVPYNRFYVLGSLAAMLAFLWTMTYLMARAIRREAEVARLQSDFVAAVSHEFRSPLTTVRQMAEMLELGELPPARQQTYYRVLVQEATRLQRLVETLLNFGRMEAGAAQYHFAPVDPAALVRAVVQDIEPQARAAGKQIEVRGEETPVRVLADESALTLAVRNLLDNAIKYSPDQPTVWIEWQTEAGRTAIKVIDRGLGIARAEQDAVFGKFVRGREAIARNLKGTGVGLSMVRQIVDAHGGEIRLESDLGHGSTFTVLLPTAP